MEISIENLRDKAVESAIAIPANFMESEIPAHTLIFLCRVAKTWSSRKLGNCFVDTVYGRVLLGEAEETLELAHGAFATTVPGTVRLAWQNLGPACLLVVDSKLPIPITRTNACRPSTKTTGPAYPAKLKELVGLARYGKAMLFPALGKRSQSFFPDGAVRFVYVLEGYVRISINMMEIEGGFSAPARIVIPPDAKVVVRAERSEACIIWMG